MVEFITEAGALKNFLKAIYPVTREIRVHATPEGLTAISADVSNVSMVIATLKKEKLQCYQGDGTFGIDVEKLLSAIKDTHETDLIEIKIAEEITVKTGRMVFSTPVLDPASIRKEPKLSEDVLKRLNINAVIDAEEFVRALKLAQSVDGQIEIGRKQTLFIRSQNQTEKIEIMLPEQEGTGEGISGYNAEYLREFFLKGTVTISFANDFLMRLSCSSNGVDWSYIIAPRVRF